MSSNPAADPKHGQHLRRLNTAHNLVREAIFNAESAPINPQRAYIPDGTEKGVQDVLNLHTAVMDYRDEVAFFRDQLPKKVWMDEVATIQVPKETVVNNDRELTEAGRRKINYFLEMNENHSQLGGGRSSSDDWPKMEEESLSLSTMGRWRFEQRTYEIPVKFPHCPQGADEKTVRVIIPPSVAAKAYDRLNACLAHLDLRAKIEEQRAGQPVANAGQGISGAGAAASSITGSNDEMADLFES